MTKGVGYYLPTFIFLLSKYNKIFFSEKCLIYRQKWISILVN